MLLMVTLVAAGTWNPPMEETKTAEPPPRDSKRGTQAWELARKMKRKSLMQNFSLLGKKICGSFCQSVKSLAVQSSARSHLTTKAMSYIFVGLN